MGKTQKSEELKGFHDFCILQASIQEENIANGGSMWVCSSFLGPWKEQRNIKFYCKDEESSNLQALIREAALAEDGQLYIGKGKDRHDTDGSLSLGLGEASGRVDVPVSVTKLIDPAFRSPQSVVVNQSLRVTTTHRVSDDTMILGNL